MLLQMAAAIPRADGPYPPIHAGKNTAAPNIFQYGIDLAKQLDKFRV